MEFTIGHILCYSGSQGKKEHGVGFVIHREIAGNMEAFFSISERAAAVVIKLNKAYRLKIVQAYAPITTYED